MYIPDAMIGFERARRAMLASRTVIQQSLELVGDDTGAKKRIVRFHAKLQRKLVKKFRRPVFVLGR